MTDFKVINNKKDAEFYYSNDVNKKKYKHLIFYIKNIGNANINELYICATSQKNTMLCSINGKSIKIDIAYLENSKICNAFSSELALIFKDSFDNLYEQPFFIQQNNLYEPHLISFDDLKVYTQVDTAIECFRNPLMWK